MKMTMTQWKRAEHDLLDGKSTQWTEKTKNQTAGYEIRVSKNSEGYQRYDICSLHPQKRIIETAWNLNDVKRLVVG